MIDAMEKGLVTIVTPVYNVSEYLRETLEGISSQTYGKWELILVDDGSTDGSGEMCDDYCRNERRAKTIHQCNRGQAVARDVAIAQARGEWLAFVDADDIPHPNYIERMVRVAKKHNVDIVECDFLDFAGAVPPFPLCEGDVKVKIQGRENVARVALDCQTTVTALWGKLFHGALFDGMRCPNGQLYEDEYLIPRLYYKADSYCLLSDRLYLYRRRQGSTMTEAYGEKRAFANIGVFKDRLNFFQGKLGDSIDGVLLFRHCMMMCTILERIRASESIGELGECRSLCLGEIRSKGAECLGSRSVSLWRKALVIVAMISPRAITFLRAIRKGAEGSKQ